VPIYLFRALDGSIVERYLSMDEAPEIGSNILDPEGEGNLTRLPSNSPRRDIVRDYAGVGHSLPRVYNGREVAKRRRAEAAKEADPEQKEALLQSASDWEGSTPIWKKTTPEGKPIFESARDVREFQERTGHRYQWGQD